MLDEKRGKNYTKLCFWATVVGVIIAAMTLMYTITGDDHVRTSSLLTPEERIITVKLDPIEIKVNQPEKEKKTEPSPSPQPIKTDHALPERVKQIISQYATFTSKHTGITKKVFLEQVDSILQNNVKLERTIVKNAGFGVHRFGTINETQKLLHNAEYLAANGYALSILATSAEHKSLIERCLYYITRIPYYKNILKKYEK